MMVFRTMRPKQLTKNMRVFLPLFFTLNEAWEFSNVMIAMEYMARSVGAFIVFSALSGAIYIVNDIADADNDRAHPRKKFRPLASGALPLRPAAAAAATVISVVVGTAFVLQFQFGGVVLGYVFTMLVYSWALKSIIMIDVISISVGFILRVVAGAVALDVPISIWLYVCTGLGALFIALSKRRSELAVAGALASEQRQLLGSYTVGWLDRLIIFAGICAMACYIAYTLTASNLPENYTMVLTIPFVAFGVIRYWYLVRVLDRGENPEEIVISDLPMILTIVLWVLTGALVLLAFR